MTFIQLIISRLSLLKTLKIVPEKMAKLLVLLLTVYLATSVYGYCFSGGGKSLKLYKKLNRVGTSWTVKLWNFFKNKFKISVLKVHSDYTCINLITSSTPFISAKASGSYSCKIYPKKNCGGTSKSVPSSGVNYSAGALSTRCPCWIFKIFWYQLEFERTIKEFWKIIFFLWSRR